MCCASILPACDRLCTTTLWLMGICYHNSVWVVLHPVRPLLAPAVYPSVQVNNFSMPLPTVSSVWWCKPNLNQIYFTVLPLWITSSHYIPQTVQEVSCPAAPACYKGLVKLLWVAKHLKHLRSACTRVKALCPRTCMVELRQWQYVMTKYYHMLGFSECFYWMFVYQLCIFPHPLPKYTWMCNVHTFRQDLWK